MSASSTSILYKRLIRPLLFQMDPEKAHELAHRLLAYLPPAQSQTTYAGPLTCKFGETRLRNPIGLAAGFDKNGSLVHALAYLGFGFAEIGSITGRPGQGNPKPRLFRLPADNAIINRMGLNGIGAEAVSRRLAQSHISLPVGINIAKTNDSSIKGDAAVQDILSSFQCIKDLPILYVTVNSSCPNTKEGVVSESKMLADLLAELSKANVNQLPILLKLSSDSSHEFIEDAVSVSTKYGIAGFVCSNTTTSRDSLTNPQQIMDKIGAGGLSGQPLKQRAVDLCRRVSALKQRKQLIIGCGGISSAKDAMEFINAGATYIQLYTSLIYEGPDVAIRIAKELPGMLEMTTSSLLAESSYPDRSQDKVMVKQ